MSRSEPPDPLEPTAAAEYSVEKERASSERKTRRQIRGSSVLLAGRFLSRGANFASQVLIVRYLAKSDYGAFAYALTIVTFFQTFMTFGLDRAITRFVPIYHEEEEYDKMFGTMGMVFSTVLGLGILIILLLYLFQDGFIRTYLQDDLAFSLVLILIFLAPLQAIDELLIGLFAVFASPGAIFFRKYVLTPGLKLAVVLLLILTGRNVYFLASGYLAAGALGVSLYVVMLLLMLRREGLGRLFNRRTLELPWREVLAFTVPLMTSDLLYMVMNTVDAVMLEYFDSTVEVASLRAVQPTAKLNQMVLASFGLLFTPAAARMFAREDKEGINNLYWQNAVWIAIASFPIFVLTFSLARPITVLLYEERYADSATILALLSLGYYFNAALGQNGLTLKVYGKLRYIVTLNIAAGVANLVAAFLLIPRYGALGAALATAGTMILHNIFKQAGLGLGTGINIFEPRYVRVYATIVLAAVGLWLLQTAASLPWYASVVAAGLVSLALLRINRRLLSVETMFPELLRIGLLRRFLAG